MANQIYSQSIWRWVIGLCVLLTVALRLGNSSFRAAVFGQIQTDSLTFFILLSFVVLGLAAAFGLFMKRVWGYLAFYPFVLIATFGLSISVVPFIPRLLPANITTSFIVIANLFLAVILIFLHRSHVKEGS